MLAAQPGLHSLPGVQKKPWGQPPAQPVGSTVHMPLLQNWLALQSVPQLLQLRSSLRVSTHEPEHAVLPAAHMSGPVVPPPVPPPAPPPLPPPPPLPLDRQSPWLQSWPGKQVVQSWPPAPHASPEAPSWHCPEASQQPAVQVVGSHPAGLVGQPESAKSGSAARIRSRKVFKWGSPGPEPVVSPGTTPERKGAPCAIFQPMRALLALCFLVALPSLAEAPEKKVARLWKAKCAACHGVDGRGQTESGRKLKLPDFTSAAWQARTSDEFIRNRVSNGLEEVRDGVDKQMPAFKDELEPAHLEAIVTLLRKLAAPP